MFMYDISIIPAYDTEERDINKFKQLIENSTYIKDTEQFLPYIVFAKDSYQTWEILQFLSNNG